MAKKIFLVIGALLILIFIVTFIAWWQGKKKAVPAVAEVIKIGMIGPLTGGAAKYGIEARNGAQLAISQLNERQSFYRYESVSVDNQADPDLAEKGARDLVADEGVLAVVGDITSSCTLSSGVVFQKAGLPAVSPSATSPKVSEIGPFQFRVCPSDTYQGKALAEFVVGDLGLYRIAIFWDEKNVDYSGQLADAFSERAEQLGGVITERLFYRAGQKEFTPFLERLLATNPEVLFIPGYYTEAALIAHQARAMDWEIPIVGGDGFHALNLIEIGGKAVEGVKFTSFFSADDPRVQEFVLAYQARYGEVPGWIAAHSYDAMNIITEAIKMEGASREGIQRGLSKIEGFKGVTGLISFDEKGDVIKDILKLEVKEGKFRVWAP